MSNVVTLKPRRNQKDKMLAILENSKITSWGGNLIDSEFDDESFEDITLYEKQSNQMKDN